MKVISLSLVLAAVYVAQAGAAPLKGGLKGLKPSDPKSSVDNFNNWGGAAVAGLGVAAMGMNADASNQALANAQAAAGQQQPPAQRRGFFKSGGSGSGVASSTTTPKESPNWGGAAGTVLGGVAAAGGIYNANNAMQAAQIAAGGGDPSAQQQQQQPPAQRRSPLNPGAALTAAGLVGAGAGVDVSNGHQQGVYNGAVTMDSVSKRGLDGADGEAVLRRRELGRRLVSVSTSDQTMQSIGNGPVHMDSISGQGAVDTATAAKAVGVA